MSCSKRRRNNRGAVSLYSLWFAIIVVVFAVGFIYIVNSVIKEGQIVNYDVDATLKAYSVLNSLMFSIATGDLKRKSVISSKEDEIIPQKEILLDGSEYKSGINNTSYKVQDSNGLIILGAKKVQISRLNRLLEKKGIDKKGRMIIVGSFLDWIDMNDMKRLNGAERDYYESEQDLGYHPRNRPLEYKKNFS
jgi:general secretion pathway protein K